MHFLTFLLVGNYGLCDQGTEMSLPFGHLMELLVLLLVELVSHGKALTHWKT